MRGKDLKGSWTKLSQVKSFTLVGRAVAGGKNRIPKHQLTNEIDMQSKLHVVGSRVHN